MGPCSFAQRLAFVASSEGAADTPWVDFEFDQSSPAEWDVGA